MVNIEEDRLAMFNLSAAELQGLMRHKSYQTTQKYIRMAAAVSWSAEKLSVPSVLSDGRSTAKEVGHT